eukprot:5547405-Amphidinium_carterae.1
MAFIHPICVEAALHISLYAFDSPDLWGGGGLQSLAAGVSAMQARPLWPCGKESNAFDGHAH